MSKRWRKGGKRVRNPAGKRTRVEECCCDPPCEIFGSTGCSGETMPSYLNLTITGCAPITGDNIWTNDGVVGDNRTYWIDPPILVPLNGTWELACGGDELPFNSGYGSRFKLADVSNGLLQAELWAFMRCYLTGSQWITNVSCYWVRLDGCDNLTRVRHGVVQVWSRRAGWPANTQQGQQEHSAPSCGGTLNAVHSLIWNSGTTNSAGFINNATGFTFNSDTSGTCLENLTSTYSPSINNTYGLGLQANKMVSDGMGGCVVAPDLNPATVRSSVCGIVGVDPRGYSTDLEAVPPAAWGYGSDRESLVFGVNIQGAQCSIALP